MGSQSAFVLEDTMPVENSGLPHTSVAPKTPMFSGERAVVLKEDSNPEGKGVNGFLLDWHRSTPQDVMAKPSRQILAEFFTSMLALTATFKYKPVVERSNYLYWIDGHWSLSLIAPEEWSAERRASFAGTLTLQRDMTWTISPSDRLAKHAPMANALRQLYNAFIDTLDTDRPIEDVLPFYVRSMPYYRRLYAAALSRSVRASVRLGDQASISCRQWSSLLPQRNGVLLAYRA